MENKIIKYRIIGKIVSPLEHKVINFNGVKLQDNYTLEYNYPDQSLYIVYRNITNEIRFDREEKLAEVASQFNVLLSKSVTMEIKGEVLDLAATVEPIIEQSLIVENFTIKNYTRLSDIANSFKNINIFNSSQFKNIYELFLTNPIMVEQLKEFCNYSKIKFDETADTIAKLPSLQLFVEEIGEVYVLDKIIKYFSRYLAAAFILTFDDLEYKDDIATLIVVNKKFGSYIVELLEDGLHKVDYEQFQQKMQEVLDQINA